MRILAGITGVACFMAIPVLLVSEVELKPFLVVIAAMIGLVLCDLGLNGPAGTKR